MIDRLCTGL